MSNIVKPFPSIEEALKNLLVRDGAGITEDHVGGNLAFDPFKQDFYVRIERIDSKATRHEGAFTVDVEVFGVNYFDVESRSMDIEALLLGYPFVVEVGGRPVVFDEVSQNTGPRELPWEDDRVSRLGATYVILARRR